MYLCPSEKFWQILCQGEGPLWQEKLAGLEDFKIEQSTSHCSNRAQHLFKSGCLLYLYAGGGKGSLDFKISLIVKKDKTMQFKPFFSCFVNRYYLCTDTNFLPFSFMDDDPCATEVVSYLKGRERALQPFAEKVGVLLKRISKGKVIEPQEFLEPIEEFKKLYTQAAVDAGMKGLRYPEMYVDPNVLNHLKVPQKLAFLSGLFFSKASADKKPTELKKFVEHSLYDKNVLKRIMRFV